MEIVLARQGIYDQNKELVAYELLYRNSYENAYDENIEKSEATMKVVNAVSKLGEKLLTEGKRAFVNFPEKCIINELCNVLNKDRVVIEILEDVVPTIEILEEIKRLKQKGYIIALDDVTVNTMHSEFGTLIDIYKIDFMETTFEERKMILENIKKVNFKAQFLAEKVETEEEFKEGLENDYAYFQGYYFSRPYLVTKED